MHSTFQFNTEKEIQLIASFLKDVLHASRKGKLIVASSGGVDSSVALALCVKAVGPKNVLMLTLPYKDFHKKSLELSTLLSDRLEIPLSNRISFSITDSVDRLATELSLSEGDKIRFGNMTARMRMIYLYDQAKKMDALVCGTENRSEYYLGYFTRFGDEASDIEPIRHLYKTQIYMLASALSLPEAIVHQKPTAALWEGQTDEGEFGFSYEEADRVLFLHFDKKIAFEDISVIDFPNRDAIHTHVLRNEFKHTVPYIFEKN